ncbi:hypothetical protein MBLNU230_g0933t1 [Neophaeotheca triangularis]
MASHLPKMLAFPPDEQLSPDEYDVRIREYYKELKDMPASAWTGTFEKKRVLDLLNPTVNSLAYLFALLANRDANKSNKTFQIDLLERAVIFSTSFDQKQIRYAGMYWRHLFEWMIESFRKQGIQDLTPLSAAILHLDPTAATFTTTHLAFLRICMDQGSPRQALPILDKNLLSIPRGTVPNAPEVLSDDELLSNAYMTKSSGFSLKMSVEYILEYYLLGAQVYIGLRRWDRARLFLEQVILSPSFAGNNGSALQVEAYKKWVMVGLLSQGSTFNQPRTAEQAIMASIRKLSRAYETLAEIFEKRDWLKFQAEMAVGWQLWDNDGNLRLVTEASDALLKYRVIDLQKTYAALPVSRVAHSLGFSTDETFGLLTNLIQTAQVHASIASAASGAPGDAVLRFHLGNGYGSNIAQQNADVEAQTKRIEELVKYIRDADRQLQLSKEFVDVTKRTRKLGPDSDPTDQMDLDYSGPTGGMGGGGFDDGEEDLMVR